MTTLRYTTCALKALLVVCALARMAWPQTKEPVYELGNGVTPPRITHQVAPEHPAHGFRLSGTVLLGLVVTSQGEPDGVHVVRSLEKEMDQAAIDAVQQWRFDPATKDGKPVAVKISVEIRFHDI